jgi:hypothetical protein
MFCWPCLSTGYGRRERRLLSEERASMFCWPCLSTGYGQRERRLISGKRLA